MPPSETFSEAWGVVVICVLISAALNGCIAIQACSYFSTFRTDPLLLKSAVRCILLRRLSDMLHLMCECWLIHSVGILGYGRPFYAVMVPIGFSIAVALEVIVHVIVQGVYIFRMYRFGKNPYILASCCALVLVEAGMGFAWAGWVAASAIMLQVDARNQQIRWMITCFFTISAFVDVFITASLSYQLWQSRMMGLKRCG
ncbi:hypothetical protein BD779DRAFT_1542959 [Infundibulicybe gibba]|nr:hypothetical protein BD779DRAFT_1542959 [Infundibulicybe gibba]